MEEVLFTRNVMQELQATYRESPVTLIVGARQVGKSTLMRQLLQTENARIVNLDESAVRQAALNDPDGFVGQFPQGTLAIDEIQRVPELMVAIKAQLERDRRPGRFVVTGSANLLSLKGAQESLAGRMQSVHVRGLTQGEKMGVLDDFASYSWGLSEQPAYVSPTALTRAQYLEIAGSTGYPGIQKRHVKRQKRWFRDYVDAIFSKDVSTVSAIRNPERLPQLFSLLACENASEFVVAVSARKLNIPERSLPAYVDALKKVFLIDVLPAWSTNVAKRVVSRPKIVVSDPGLTLSLCNVTPETIQRDLTSPITGGIVEGFVVTQLLAQQVWSAVDYQLYHYRDRLGNEVDVIMENDDREVVGVEVKAAVSLSRKDFSGLTFLRHKLGEKFKAGIVLYAGEHVLSFGERLWAMPLAMLWEHSSQQ